MFNVDVSFAEESEDYCIICGASGTACCGKSYNTESIVFVDAEPANDPAATYRVPHRVFDEKESNGRVTRTLLYAAGSWIRPERARRLIEQGLITEVKEKAEG